MALIEKKESFAKAIIEGLSNKDAAIRAGYSAATASAAGSRLAKDEQVVERINELKAQAQALAVVLERSNAVDFDVERYSEGVTGERQPIDRETYCARDRAIFDGNTVELDGVTYFLSDSKDALTLHMLGVISMTKSQQDSAKSLLPFTHGKVADMGKKGAQEKAAQQAAVGRFSPLEPPEPRQARLLM